MIPPGPVSKSIFQMKAAVEALRRLRDGNRRFVAGKGSRDLATEHSRRFECIQEQEPFAIVLGCSDSRVPAELVFDQGLGDLFVIRVAGNIVAPSQVGSIEFAADRFGTLLVVVLGHSQCGAVQAAVETLGRPQPGESPNLGFIVKSIRPSIEAVLLSRARQDEASLLRNAIRENIRTSANKLRNGSEVLERLIHDNGLLVVGAEYSLETGVVDFFDGVPEAG
jgi:carbonic anhydrase